MVNSRRGRPASAGVARQSLVDAARRHLETGDLADVSSRTLADESGVSHTLVNYHFGSRDGLVAAAIGAAVAPHDVVALARDESGRIDLRRLAQGILAAWEDPRISPRLREAAGSYAAGDRTSDTVGAYIDSAVITPLIEEFGLARGRRLITGIVGFLFGRYVLRIAPLASLSRDEAAAHLMSLLH